MHQSAESVRRHEIASIAVATIVQLLPYIATGDNDDGNDGGVDCDYFVVNGNDGNSSDFHSSNDMTNDDNNRAATFMMMTMVIM